MGLIVVDGAGSPKHLKATGSGAIDDPFVLEKAVSPVDSNYSLLTAVINFSASGDNTIVAAPGAGKKLRIYKVFAVMDRGNQAKLTYKSGSTAKSGPMDLEILVDENTWGLFLECGVNEAFVINSSAAVQVSGYVLYRQVNV